VRRVGIEDIAGRGVLDDVALVVGHARRPVAAVVTDHLTRGWVAIGVECKGLVGPHRGAGQGHVNRGGVSLRCLQRTGQALGILLSEDGLLVELVVERVGEEVATGREVS